MASGDRSKQDFWRRMIQRQRESGLSVRAWCGRHDVSEASFYWWRRRLAGSGGRAATSGRREPKPARRQTGAPRFVPVRVAADPAGAATSRKTFDEANGRPGCIEILLSGRQRVRVRGAVDRQALADVLAVLQSGDADGIVEAGPAVDGEAAAC